MKPYNLLFDLHKFIPSRLFLNYKTKHIENFCFHSWKETLAKDIPIECTYPFVYDEYYKNGFTITSENSLRMMNLLIL